MKDNRSKKVFGKVPLERCFSKLGLASRSQARAWIQEGRVSVDGKVIRDPESLFVPEKVSLKVTGIVLEKNPWRVLLLYKPKGVVTTRSDEKGRSTVFSLLTEQDGYLHSVGRLDMATTGLLLLTNDTRLSSWLIDPVNRVTRVYLVTVRGLLKDEDLAVFVKGVIDKKELLKADRAILRKASQRESHLTLELTQGKNREIRRLCEALGHEVTSLKRVAFGGLQLGNLNPGESRRVSKGEIIQAFGREWCKE